MVDTLTADPVHRSLRDCTPSEVRGDWVVMTATVSPGESGIDRYAYCHNNPVRYTDPTGHDPHTNGGQPITGTVNEDPDLDEQSGEAGVDTGDAAESDGGDEGEAGDEGGGAGRKILEAGGDLAMAGLALTQLDGPLPGPADIIGLTLAGVGGAVALAGLIAEGVETLIDYATGDADVPEAQGTTPEGRPLDKHYEHDPSRGPARNIPGSVVDNTINNYPGVAVENGKTVHYDPGNNVTVVTGNGGVVVSVHKGPPRTGQY